MLPAANCKLAVDCMHVLFDDQDDKEYRLMVLSVDDKSFKDIAYQQDPPTPGEYNAFKMLDQAKQKAAIVSNPSFYTTGVIGGWMKKMSETRSQNRTWRLWLQDCVKVFTEKSDKFRLQKVKDRLDTFPADGKKDIQDDEVNACAEQFSGSVSRATRKVFGYDD